jgi:hypothetical protein
MTCSPTGTATVVPLAFSSRWMVAGVLGGLAVVLVAGDAVRGVAVVVVVGPGVTVAVVGVTVVVGVAVGVVAAVGGAVVAVVAGESGEGRAWFAGLTLLAHPASSNAEAISPHTTSRVRATSISQLLDICCRKGPARP